MAKLAEKGKITGIFFADVYGLHDSYPGQVEAQLVAGANCAQLDPLMMVSAMASVSNSVCFGITGSTSYVPVSVIDLLYSLWELESRTHKMVLTKCCQYYKFLL